MSEKAVFYLCVVREKDGELERVPDTPTVSWPEADLALLFGRVYRPLFTHLMDHQVNYDFFDGRRGAPYQVPKGEVALKACEPSEVLDTAQATLAVLQRYGHGFPLHFQLSIPQGGLERDCLLNSAVFLVAGASKLELAADLDSCYYHFQGDPEHHEIAGPASFACDKVRHGGVWTKYSHEHSHVEVYCNSLLAHFDQVLADIIHLGIYALKQGYMVRATVLE